MRTRVNAAPSDALVFFWAIGLNVMDPDEQGTGQRIELLASRRHGGAPNEAYERLLSDAMAGDQTLFARQDYVEEAWRIVDAMVSAGTPLYHYEPRTWGPTEATSVSPAGGWHDPLWSPRRCDSLGGLLSSAQHSQVRGRSRKGTRSLRAAQRP